MKRTIIALAFLFACIAADAQTLRMDQVPKAAAHTFRAKYTAAQQESWERISDSLYQVSFFNGKKSQIARYDVTGRWIETETDITGGSVPAAVSRAIPKNFPGFDIQIISQIESPEGTLTYEAVLFKGRENYDVIFSAKGEILKKELGQPNE